jgi:type IV fimbrial biogenesis protein FimT
MLIRARAMQGMSLIELLMGLVVLGILVMIGLPSLSAWIQNTQIRTSAEGIYAALQLARAEALRRNAVVRFQLVNTLDSTCILAAIGTSWVVSLDDPSGQCEKDPSEDPLAGPRIVQKRNAIEGSPNVTVAATGGSTVRFNGLGRVTGANPITQIDVANPGGGACKTAAGPMRCLRLTVSSGGEARMCDPAFDIVGDPRHC